MKTYSQKQIALILGLVMLFLASLSFVKAGGDLNRFQANLLSNVDKTVFTNERDIENFKTQVQNSEFEPVVLDVDKSDIEF